MGQSSPNATRQFMVSGFALLANVLYGEAYQYLEMSSDQVSNLGHPDMATDGQAIELRKQAQLPEDDPDRQALMDQLHELTVQVLNDITDGRRQPDAMQVFKRPRARMPCPSLTICIFPDMRTARVEESVALPDMLAHLLPQVSEMRRVSRHPRQLSGETCVICQDEYTSREYYRSLECGHVFHKRCIDKWCKKCGSLQCPCCRKNFMAEYMLEQVRVPSDEEALVYDTQDPVFCVSLDDQGGII